MDRPAILIVAIDQRAHHKTREHLGAQGFEVIEESGIAGALQSIQIRNPVMVIVGPSEQDAWDELEIAGQIRQVAKTLPFILINRHSSEARAIAALRSGVNDYFTVPFSCRELLASIRKLLTEFPKSTSSARRPSCSTHNGESRLVGESEEMREIEAYLPKVANTDSTVLITGETGTGKERIAEMIHRLSPRHKAPLVNVNCAAVPDSLLESELFGYEKGAFTGAHSSYSGKLKLAEGGTVFLDEIGDMSPCAQAKILRVIEDKQVYRLGGNQSIPLNVRVIAATNQNLEHLMEEDKFRQDLYFRLNVAGIELPPLRDRKGDIPLLLDHFLQGLNGQFGREVQGFTEEGLELLLHYDWPGNIRELKNFLESVFIALPAQKVVFLDIPKPLRQRFQKAEPALSNEQDRLLAALHSTNWNKSQAAQKLHWSRMTLYRKIAKYHITSSRFK